MIEWPNLNRPEGDPRSPEYIRELIGMGWVEIGSGDEATCYRNLNQADRSGEVVMRVCHSFDEKTGRSLYLRHSLCRRLENIFMVTRKYRLRHITVAQFPFFGGYCYDYAFGKEGFSWQEEPPEWREFVNAFSSCGIMVGHDVCDSDDEVGKNVVLKDDHFYRIDFGSRSLPVKKEILRSFVEKNNILVPYLDDL